MNLRSSFFLISTLCAGLGCSSSADSNADTPGPLGASGSGGQAAGGAIGAAGTAGSGGAVGASGATGQGGALGGAGGSASGAGGTTGGSAGAAGAGGIAGDAAGAGGAAGSAGTGGTGGATGGSGGMGTVTGTVRTGMSAGCGSPPPAEDSSDDYVLHEVDITGLDPVYLDDEELGETSGPYTFANRPYGVRLPTGYNPATPYKVTFGGGGCGGSAQNFAGNPGGGLQIAGNGNTIQVGLSYMGGCFNDGGPSIDNRPDSPEVPYFRAVMAQIEQDYCIDLSQVFVGGFSSGAWEAYLLGCAAADLVRGIGAHEGGMRDMHPACTGPVAAVLVAGEADTENPIGPLVDGTDDDGAINRLGSHGSAPGRDDILMRNNCIGTATVPYEDPTYGACVRYTGCPENYPVIWCALPGVGHNSSEYMGTDYSPGPMWDVLGALPPP